MRGNRNGGPAPHRDREFEQELERKIRQYGAARHWPEELKDWNDDQLREAAHAVKHGLDLPSTEGL